MARDTDDGDLDSIPEEYCADCGAPLTAPVTAGRRRCDDCWADAHESVYSRDMDPDTHAERLRAALREQYGDKDDVDARPR